jgi:hypothetical protein
MLMLLLLAAPARAQDPAVRFDVQPARPAQGEVVRLTCRVSNSLATPIALVGVEVTSNWPGMSPHFTFLDRRTRVDSMREEEGQLTLVRHWVVDNMPIMAGREPFPSYLDGRQESGLVQMQRLLAPGQEASLEFSGLAVPLGGQGLDLLARVSYLPLDPGQVWVPAPWTPAVVAPGPGWGQKPSAEPPVLVAQYVRWRAHPQAAEGLVAEALLENLRRHEVHLALAVEKGAHPLEQALAAAGLAPGQAGDAALLPRAWAWALETREGTTVVQGPRVTRYPAPLAAWFRRLALEGQASARLEVWPPQPPQVQALLDLFPSQEAKAGSRVYEIPVDALPDLLARLQQAGARVGAGKVEAP